MTVISLLPVVAEAMIDSFARWLIVQANATPASMCLLLSEELIGA
jgi:hypothetical protein